ncbi:MAG: hypothetical protein HDS49_05775 [Bacteroides sp.]|nr:hypothetical protein [Bacteroides sp.]
MIVCNIEFLGGSQTFLGVLIALLVIMPYQKSGNPFYDLLTKIKEDIKGEISRAFSGETFSRLENSDSYKKITKAQNGEGELAVDCRNFLALIRFKVTGGSLSFYSEQYVKKLDNMFALKEVYLSPFYMFLFCLVVFAVDEILRVGWTVDYVIGFVLWFISMTFAFWIMIWAMYGLDLWRLISEKECGRLLKNEKYLDREFCFSILYFIVTYMVWLISIGNVGFIFFICVMALVLTKGFMSFRYLYNHYSIGYRYVINHFGFIGLASLFFALIYEAVSHEFTEFPYQIVTYTSDKPDLETVKMLMFVTVLLIGLILPFGFPYFSMWLIKKNALGKAEKVKKDADLLISELQSEVDGFALDKGL